MRVKRLLPYLLSCLILLSSIIPAALAVAPQDFPTTLPTDHVVDGAEVLSRAVRSELEARLQDLERDRIDARLITLKRLDYGLTLTDFGDKLLKRWAITDQCCHRSWRITRCSVRLGGPACPPTHQPHCTN